MTIHQRLLTQHVSGAYSLLRIAAWLTTPHGVELIAIRLSRYVIHRSQHSQLEVVAHTQRPLLKLDAKTSFNCHRTERSRDRAALSPRPTRQHGLYAPEK